MTDNEKRFYKESWEVQDACNLRGVTTGLAFHLEVLEAEGKTDDELRKHPATLTWMDKINDMMGRPAQTPPGRDADRSLGMALRNMFEHMCALGSQDGIGETEIRQNATTMAWVSTINAMLGNPEDREVSKAFDDVLEVVKPHLGS